VAHAGVVDAGVVKAVDGVIWEARAVLAYDNGRIARNRNRGGQARGCDTTPIIITVVRGSEHVGAAGEGESTLAIRVRGVAVAGIVRARPVETIDGIARETDAVLHDAHRHARRNVNRREAAAAAGHGRAPIIIAAV